MLTKAGRLQLREQITQRAAELHVPLEGGSGGHPHSAPVLPARDDFQPWGPNASLLLQGTDKGVDGTGVYTSWCWETLFPIYSLSLLYAGTFTGFTFQLYREWVGKRQLLFTCYHNTKPKENW